MCTTWIVYVYKVMLQRLLWGTSMIRHSDRKLIIEQQLHLNCKCGFDLSFCLLCLNPYQVTLRERQIFCCFFESFGNAFFLNFMSFGCSYFYLLWLRVKSIWIRWPACIYGYRYDFRVKKKEIDSLLEDFGGDLTLPDNFEKTVKCYDGVSDKKKGKQPQCQVRGLDRNYISKQR